MKDIFNLFEIETIKNELYSVMDSSLKKFSLTEQNENIYALAFDCQSDSGTVMLKFMSKKLFEKLINDLHSDTPESMIYGLDGLEYSVGDFEEIAYSSDEEIELQSKQLVYFFDIYYLIMYGFYYKDTPPKQLKIINDTTVYSVVKNESNNYFELIIPKDKEEYFEGIREQYRKTFLDIVLDCTLRLKESSNYINKTDDFIIFFVDNESEESDEIFIRKTVSKDLYNKLLDKSK